MTDLCMVDYRGTILECLMEKKQLLWIISFECLYWCIGSDGGICHELMKHYRAGGGGGAGGVGRVFVTVYILCMSVR